jgi:hypothetical protein
MILVLFVASVLSRGIWTKVDSISWWESQSQWVIGSNFIPSSAVNQLEMWQEADYDNTTISRELAWAATLGMTTMRVFLHDLVRARDSIAIALKHLSTA